MAAQVLDYLGIIYGTHHPCFGTSSPKRFEARNSIQRVPWYIGELWSEELHSHFIEGEDTPTHQQESVRVSPINKLIVVVVIARTRVKYGAECVQSSLNLSLVAKGSCSHYRSGVFCHCTCVHHSERASCG
jgi:hypothetical protein